MTDAVRYPLVLGLISLCSAAGLALTYRLTRDEIRYQEQLKRDRGLAQVFGIQLEPKPGVAPPWRTVEPATPPPEGQAACEVYEAKSPETGQPLYAAEGGAQGYSSRVEVVISVTAGIRQGLDKAEIRDMKVVKQAETPGLGSKSADPAFQEQFEHLPVPQLQLQKNKPYRNPKSPEGAKEEITAITGATITSNAVIDAVRQAVERIHQRLQEPPAREGPPAKP